MPPYDTSRFNPPAPVVQATVRNSQDGINASGISMLLDTGADVTLIPRSAADAAGIRIAEDQYYELMGFDGTISRAAAARMEMVFLGRTFRGQFLLTDQDWGIIGRDVLNLLAMVLDGPKLSWSLQQR